MSEHASVKTSSPTPPSTSPGPTGTAFFPPSAQLPSVVPGGNGVRPFPYVDDDHEPAPEVSAETKLNDSKDVVTQAFGWMGADVEGRLDILESDLRVEDQPTFGEQLLRAAFRTAITAATSGASEFIAGLLMGGKAEALRELVKSAIENGVGEAIEIASNALQGSDPLKAFIEGHKRAARHQYRKAQAHWIHKGRHRLHTQQQVDQLESTLTEERMVEAANHYYIAVRNAWLTYLAQARYGVRHSKAVDENYDIVDIGPTTDLTPSEQREVNNSLRPDSHTTTDSPDDAAAFFGLAKGVLMVKAELPAIRAIDNSGYVGMAGRATIIHAQLDGANKVIRDQFVGMPLAVAHIPRVIACSVDGGADFTVRVNEKGIVFSGRENRWVRARAIAAQPWNMGRSDAELEQIGLELLLTDLVPTKIA